MSASATTESQIDRRRAEHDREESEARDEGEHDEAGMIADRIARKPGRDQDGADAGRRAQQAEPPRPGMQDVARIDRQQRRRAAEQHREEIERDGAEHDLLAPHIAEAGEQRVEALALARRCAAAASGS